MRTQNEHSCTLPPIQVVATIRSGNYSRENVSDKTYRIFLCSLCYVLFSMILGRKNSESMLCHAHVHSPPPLFVVQFCRYGISSSCRSCSLCILEWVVKMGVGRIPCWKCVCLKFRCRQCIMHWNARHPKIITTKHIFMKIFLVIFRM